ncbi:hypothetical protein CLOM_g21895 [Closterium sp. NIES-68]|nr:hypothetical protein CLOM_g21895 [Closterium sp. NIES-68]GJP58390.1 hypothetical protein CLOP_g23642 [Closterium sp. NIES-67]
MSAAIRRALLHSRRVRPASSPLCRPTLPHSSTPRDLSPFDGTRPLHQSHLCGTAKATASQSVAARMVEKRQQERRENAVLLSMLAVGLSISGYFYYTSQIRPYSHSSPITAFPLTPSTRLPPAPGPQSEEMTGGGNKP